MEKTNIINELKDRIVDIEEKLKKSVPKKKSTNEKKPEVDEDVCPECGSDLLFVEDGIVFCSKCKQYYELNLGDEE